MHWTLQCCQTPESTCGQRVWRIAAMWDCHIDSRIIPISYQVKHVNNIRFIRKAIGSTKHHDWYVLLQNFEWSIFDQRVQQVHILLDHPTPDIVFVSPLWMTHQCNERVYAPRSRPRDHTTFHLRTVHLPFDVPDLGIGKPALNERVGRSPPTAVVPLVGVVCRSPVRRYGRAAVDGAESALGLLVRYDPFEELVSLGHSLGKTVILTVASAFGEPGFTSSSSSAIMNRVSF